MWDISRRVIDASSKMYLVDMQDTSRNNLEDVRYFTKCYMGYSDPPPPPLQMRPNYIDMKPLTSV